jgi:hypothetical protein
MANLTVGETDRSLLAFFEWYEDRKRRDTSQKRRLRVQSYQNPNSHQWRLPLAELTYAERFVKFGRIDVFGRRTGA